MAAPRIFFICCDQTSPYRVVMDIANQLEKITVPLHQHGFVTALEEMAGSFLPPVDPAGITEREILHTARQRNIANLQGHMDMVGHEAKGVNPIAKPTGPFLKQKVETIAVSIVQKDNLPAVSPENHMIKSTRKMDAWFTCHG